MQPPRRRARIGAFVGQAGFDQRVRDEALQVAGRPALHARGDFFAQDLDKQFRHRAGFPGSRVGSTLPGGMKALPAMLQPAYRRRPRGHRRRDRPRRVGA